MDRLLDHHTEIERSGAGRLDVKDGRRLGRGNGGKGPGASDRREGLVRPSERREAIRRRGQVNSIEPCGLGIEGNCGIQSVSE
jgi:hypothetical protein